jgi:hypothetical protein
MPSASLRCAPSAVRMAVARVRRPQYGSTEYFVDVMSLNPAEQVGDTLQPDNAAPSLPSQYRRFIASMSSPDPHSGIGILPHGFCHLSLKCHPLPPLKKQV